MKPLCAHCAQSLRAQVVHNGKPPSLHNEAAQCKSIVRSAWHNGRAYIGEAKSAWHNVFVIVRFFFDIYIYIYIYFFKLKHSRSIIRNHKENIEDEL